MNEILDTFARNDLYEYKVERVVDDKTGMLNVGLLQMVLTNYALDGWRLKTSISNEIGKNSTSVGYAGVSVGGNATINEIILIFERKLQTSSEIEQKIKEKQQQEVQRIEQVKQEEIRKQEEFIKKCESAEMDYSAEELLELYNFMADKKSMLLNLVKSFGKPVTAAEVREKFAGKVDLLSIATFLKALVDEGKLKQDEDTKKYYV